MFNFESNLFDVKDDFLKDLSMRKAIELNYIEDILFPYMYMNNTDKKKFMYEEIMNTVIDIFNASILIDSKTIETYMDEDRIILLKTFRDVLAKVKLSNNIEAFINFMHKNNMKFIDDTMNKILENNLDTFYIDDFDKMLSTYDCSNKMSEENLIELLIDVKISYDFIENTAFSLEIL